MNNPSDSSFPVDPYLVLMDCLAIAKAKVEKARQMANFYCQMSKLAEVDYSHANRDLERLETELKWMRDGRVK